MIPQLLVSVRNAGEAAVVARHAVAIVDIKDPSRGALGRPDNRTVVAIERVIDERQQLSVALGELVDYFDPAVAMPAVSRASRVKPAVNFPVGSRCSFAKFGTAGLMGSMHRIDDISVGDQRGWSDLLRCAIGQIPVSVQPVVVAYADHVQCDAPNPEQVIAAAVATGCRTILFDTCHKNRIGELANSKTEAGLFDWISSSRMSVLIEMCHGQELRVAIAGSLCLDDLETAVGVRADFIGVRGAVCESGRESLCELRLQECVERFSAAVEPLKAG